MKAFNAVLPLILTAFVATVACGDDDDDTPPPGAAGAGGTANCEGAYAAITETKLKQGVSTGACVSDADVSAICHNNINAIAQNCGIRCFAQNQQREAQATCMRQCLPPQLTPTPTVACQECYVETVLCAIAGCAAICIDTSKATECAACREEKGCTPGFYTCSGLPLPDGTKTGGLGGSGGSGGSGGAGGSPSTGGTSGSAGEGGATAGTNGQSGDGAGGSAGSTSAGASGAGAGGAAGDSGGVGAGGLNLAGAAGTLPE